MLALYRKCQTMALAASRAEYERHAAPYRKKRKPVPPLISGEGRRWVALFQEFWAGRIGEEHIKGSLLVGYIPEDSPVPVFNSYVPRRLSR